MQEEIGKSYKYARYAWKMNIEKMADPAEKRFFVC